MNANAVRFLALSAALHAGVLAYWSVDTTPNPARVKPLLLSLNAGNAADNEVFLPAPTSPTPSPAAAVKEAATFRQTAAEPTPPTTPPVATNKNVQTRPAATAISAAPPQDFTPSLNAAIPPSTPAAQDAPAQSEESMAPAARDPASVQRYLSARLRDALAPYFNYPLLAKRRGWEGKVAIGLRVEQDGHLSDIRLIASSGHGIIDRDALRVLRQLPRLDGLAGWLENKHFDMVLPIEYRLNDS